MILPMEQRRELDELGKAILKHIVERVEDTAIQPTIEELATRFGAKISRIRDELAVISERGWIELGHGASRAIQIPRDVREMFAPRREEPCAEKVEAEPVASEPVAEVLP